MIVRLAARRHAARLVLLCALGAGPRALAESPRIVRSAERAPRFGAMFDVGAPDILGLSALYRPFRWARLHVGATTNLVSAGIRGGVTIVPFDFWVRPSVTVEGGHMFDGDATWIGKLFGVQSAVLEQVGYSYVNVHGGIELGSSRRFSFFIHGGLTYMTTTLHNLQSEVRDPTVSFSDPTLAYLGPSGKIGFVFFI